MLGILIISAQAGSLELLMDYVRPSLGNGQGLIHERDRKFEPKARDPF